ncbi:MAG: nuclear transport factor 2 family protein, partial [Candidatus Neomarinimicrobiota bacterium]
MLTNRQWQKLFKNPFFLLSILVIFFIIGQFIIRSVNRSEENPIKSHVWQTVQAMNRSWTIDHNPQALRNYFHPNMIAITPGDSLRLSGQAACITGWSSFADQAQIISWKEIDPQIQIYGRNRFAIVTYYWEMDYEID